MLRQQCLAQIRILFYLRSCPHHGARQVPGPAQSALPADSATLGLNGPDKALALTKSLVALRTLLAARPEMAPQIIEKPQFAEGNGAPPFLPSLACGTGVSPTVAPDEGRASPRSRNTVPSARKWRRN